MSFIFPGPFILLTRLKNENLTLLTKYFFTSFVINKLQNIFLVKKELNTFLTTI
jgi:hypothetical protein